MTQCVNCGRAIYAGRAYGIEFCERANCEDAYERAIKKITLGEKEPEEFIAGNT